MTDTGSELGACLAGFGVAQIIDLGLENHFRSGALINLFPDWSDERFALYVYYASRNYVPANVRKFIDFVVDSLGKDGTTSRASLLPSAERLGRTRSLSLTRARSRRAFYRSSQ